MHIGKRAVLLLPIAGLALVVAALPTVVLGDNDKNDFRARLIGDNEVPSINTDATATVKLTLKSNEIDFTLSYQNLEGGNPPLFSHIHIGQQHTNGGVSAFFCGGGGKPACPSAPATVTGTIMAGDVVGPTAQGVAAGDLAGLERMIRRGSTYSNLHTTMFPTGEIRGKNVPADSNQNDNEDN